MAMIFHVLIIVLVIVIDDFHFNIFRAASDLSHPTQDFDYDFSFGHIIFLPQP